MKHLVVTADDFGLAPEANAAVDKIAVAPRPSRRIAGADSVFGLAWSGAMSTARLGRLVPHLSGGLAEISLHPSTREGFENCPRASRYTDERAALVDPDVIARTRQPDVKLGGYSDF